MKRGLIITIDGPSGVGKSTAAKSVARRLGFTYLDTGAMYRVVALQAKRNSVDINDEDSLKSLMINVNISFENKGANSMVIRLDDEDVTDQIRTREITRLSSDVATKKVVRNKLVSIQREIAKNGDVVIEGRDMGTYVFPDADFKFYLDATLDERASRRWRELESASVKVDDIREEIRLRDKQDVERSVSPLHPASNAVIIDTTNFNADAVVDKIIREVRTRA